MWKVEIPNPKPQIPNPCLSVLAALEIIFVAGANGGRVADDLAHEPSPPVFLPLLTLQHSGQGCWVVWSISVWHGKNRLSGYRLWVQDFESSRVLGLGCEAGPHTKSFKTVVRT